MVNIAYKQQPRKANAQTKAAAHMPNVVIN
jgi:hypothetical protein